MGKTEEEAREMWCPHAVASHTDPRQKLAGTGAWLHHCIASECMAWRISHTDLVATGHQVVIKCEDGLNRSQPERLPVQYGYCGLSEGRTND